MTTTTTHDHDVATCDQHHILQLTVNRKADPDEQPDGTIAVSIHADMHIHSGAEAEALLSALANLDHRLQGYLLAAEMEASDSPTMRKLSRLVRGLLEDDEVDEATFNAMKAKAEGRDGDAAATA